MKKNYILDAWLVIALSLGFGAALAGVQSGLSARIAENKLNDSLSQVPALVPGSTRGVREVSDERTVYQALDEAGQRAGWVVPGTGQGFADRIEVWNPGTLLSPLKQILRGRHESDRVVGKHGPARSGPKQAEAGSA